MSSQAAPAVVYPGAFDPVTLGHLDIIRRARRLFPELIVAVSEVSHDEKASLFPVEERLGLLRQALAEEESPPPEVTSFQGLLVEFCRARGVAMVIRGMRAASDFEYEFQMAWTNARLAREVETVFLVASEEGHFISSRLAREVARHGGALEAFVPPVVIPALRAKFAKE